MTGQDCDIAIVGGGLAGGLIALALARLRPELRVLVIERGARFGGEHVWSFFASDVAAEDSWLVEPLITARWPGYDVRFPHHERSLSTPYRSIFSERLDAALRAALPADRLFAGGQVVEVGQDRVALAGGQSLRAGAVIDARGALGMPHMTGGWQRFYGELLRLEKPHGLTRPIVMDARSPQIDGYRFFYCLPFSETELFIEDTYYTNNPQLDPERLQVGVRNFARNFGGPVVASLREDMGVLPVIGAGDFDKFWPGADSGPARAGARAGLVHPLTSYSLPDAVRFALHICRQADVSGAALARASYDWARAHWRRGSFYRMLTRLLFGAGEPHNRFRMLERFYRLPEPLIERFYAGRSTRADAVRLFAGRPPVPLLGALATLAGGGRPLASLAPLKGLGL